METLHFVVEADFIVGIARQWLFKENKPYSTCIELIENCLVNPDIDDYKRHELAEMILFGGAELSGTSDTEIFIVPNSGVDWISSKCQYFDSLVEELSNQKTIVDNYVKEKVQIIDAFDYWSYGDTSGCLEVLEDNEMKKRFIDVMKYYREDDIDDPDDDLNRLKDICDAMDYDDNYGFVKPDGTFIPVQFGDHEKFSIEYLTKNGLRKDYFDWMEKFGGATHTDYLIFVLHWVLIHNPGLGIGKVTRRSDVRLTKHQKDTIFNYYCDRNRLDLAEEYLSD